MVLTSSLSLFFLLVSSWFLFGFLVVEMKKGPNPLWIRGPWLAAID
jgi:hypothetical protein